jgi:hypothetical protein
MLFVLSYRVLIQYNVCNEGVYKIVNRVVNETEIVKQLLKCRH